MKRTAYASLVKWKNSPVRKPLKIQGARQVGKTWLMKTFGDKEFSKTAYFNFESTIELQGLFNKGLDTNQILAGLSILSGFDINNSNSLIIFDEIQAFPQAITSLKYIKEKNPYLHILAASS